MSEIPQTKRFRDIEWAYESCEGSPEMSAYVSKKTGEVVYEHEAITGDPCPVENIECHDDYIAIPDKFDLDLGTHLVWDFVHKQIPSSESKIRELFRGRGAYRRWKDWLARNDLLDAWYSFEEEAKQQALHAWCTFNKIPLDD